MTDSSQVVVCVADGGRVCAVLGVPARFVRAGPAARRAQAHRAPTGLLPARPTVLQ